MKKILAITFRDIRHTLFQFHGVAFLSDHASLLYAPACRRNRSQQ